VPSQLAFDSRTENASDGLRPYAGRRQSLSIRVFRMASISKAISGGKTGIVWESRLGWPSRADVSRQELQAPENQIRSAPAKKLQVGG